LLLSGPYVFQGLVANCDAFVNKKKKANCDAVINVIAQIKVLVSWGWFICKECRKSCNIILICAQILWDV
jgi:hypothetical protein